MGASEVSQALAEAALVLVLAALVLAGFRLGAEGRRAGAWVLVVGAGPVGLLAALAALRSGKVLKLTLLDSRPRPALLGDALGRPPLTLRPRSLRLLRRLGADPKALHGAWHRGSLLASTRALRALLLQALRRNRGRARLQLLLGTQFSEDFVRKNLASDWPNIIIVADGSCGESSAVLGISPEYIVESCNAYGANAIIERPDQRQVPTPEIRAHNLHFDLSAYGMGTAAMSQESPRSGFHLKIYGTFHSRYLALACPASDSKIERFLRHTLNSSIMKNIFLQSFNVYKSDIEPRVSELSLHHIRCSRRLFEIMLSHRKVTAALIEDVNVVVTVEGEAARVLNFDTGCEVNLGLRGLESIEELVYKVATAVDQNDILEALAAKIRHSKQVVEDFKQNGLLETMFE